MTSRTERTVNYVVLTVMAVLVLFPIGTFVLAALSPERSGKPVRMRDPYDAIRAGMVLVPADRMMALLPQRPIGLGNQVVQVDPGTDTVVVRLGTPEFLPQPPTFGPAEASQVITEAVVRR